MLNEYAPTKLKMNNPMQGEDCPQAMVGLFKRIIAHNIDLTIKPICEHAALFHMKDVCLRDLLDVTAPSVTN